jgi:hypothetical protein
MQRTTRDCFSPGISFFHFFAVIVLIILNSCSRDDSTIPRRNVIEILPRLMSLKP